MEKLTFKICSEPFSSNGDLRNANRYRKQPSACVALAPRGPRVRDQQVHAVVLMMMMKTYPYVGLLADHLALEQVQHLGCSAARTPD
jgi:hypothetical protein